MAFDWSAILFDFENLIFGCGQLHLNWIIGDFLLNGMVFTSFVQVIHPLIFLTHDLFLKFEFSFAVLNCLHFLLHVMLTELCQLLVVQRGGI